MLIKNKIFKWTLSVMLIFILSFLFIFMPDSVAYAQEGFLKWLPFILVFIVTPFLIFQILLVYGKNIALILGFGSVLILGPALGIYLEEKENQAFKNDGVITVGYIDKKWYSSGKNAEWLVKAKFKVGDKWYSTFSQSDENNLFEAKQEVEIIYVKRNPNINSIHSIYLKQR